MEAAMTETRNFHREITEERDRLRAERDELLKALKLVLPFLAYVGDEISESALQPIEAQAVAAIALAEGRRR
jgi:hypothetical protein